LEKLKFIKERGNLRKIRMQKIDEDIGREVKKVNSYLVSNLGTM
jgi:hypothetical protein